MHSEWIVSRRDFLKVSLASVAGLAASPAYGAEPTLRFGLVTDLHYADVDSLGTRHYRESLGKLRECVTQMNKQRVAFLCELGDFKDEDRSNRDETLTLEFLRAAEKEYAAFDGPRHYVMGNHDLDSISKEQFLANTTMPAPHYSFDAQGRHFVVLDANYMGEGTPYDHGKFNWQDTNIPPQEMDWLRDDLQKTELPTIVFAHQRLDGEGALFVNNAADVREVLESSGKVLAVFQGHDHPGALNTLNGIHYYTLIAVVEGAGEINNSYALVEVAANGDLTVTGYRRAKAAELPRQD